MVPSEVLAIDVGDRRIGVARANSTAKLPEPLKAIDRLELDTVEKVAEELRSHGAESLVIGLPKSMSGKSSAQTAAVQSFYEQLMSYIDMPVHFQDEALSTVEAANWRARYPQADEDSLAACVILERFFNEVKD